MPPHAAPSAPPTSPDEVVARFLAGTLDPAHWTHASHLIVCRHVLAASDDLEEAIAHLRTLIERHNARVGIRPGHGGYHETITRYFVGAVAHADPPTTTAMLTDPALRRDAPLDHWTAALLASDAARTGWVEPDRAALAWPSTFRPPT